MVIPTGVRAVFFDAVGTLLFPEPSAPVVYADAAHRQGLHITPDEVRTRFLTAYRAEENADRLSGWATSEAREAARWRRIVCESLSGVTDPDACFRELFDHFARPTSWRVNPDAGPLFARLLARGLTLGLGSNYDARLHSVLAGLPELACLRDRVVVSAAVGFRKPAGEFFREVVRVANCDPSEVLFVGNDLENDYEGATAAGLQAVLLDERGRHATVPKSLRSLAELE